MSNLFASLTTSVGALRTFERALEVTQNNINNASTPGYAKQRLALEALPFQPSNGLTGGVKAGELQSARDHYADAEVRQKLQAFGYSDQKTISLSAIEASIDVSGEGDIPGALNTLFQSFSAWSVDPENIPIRQAVIDSAQQVSMAFQRTSAELSQTANNLNLEIGRTVDNINALASKIREYNVQQLRSGGADPGIEGQVTAALEEMSDLADISVLRQEDGTVTVLLGNQTPLVVGRNQYEVSAEVYNPSAPAPVYDGAPPNMRIVDSSGRDITKQVTGGRTGALLEARNVTIASLLGDSYQAGDLNQLAKAVADTVNQLFASGVTSGGQPGVPLFTYSSSSDTAAAQSLSVGSTITS
jgi:flagellar hook-associated protein 1 FlgK